MPKYAICPFSFKHKLRCCSRINSCRILRHSSSIATTALAKRSFAVTYPELLFFLASAYASCRVSILQTWTYKPQNRQDGSVFALTYSLLLRSCKPMDAFIISSLPSLLSETLQTAGPLRSTSVTRYAVHRITGIQRCTFLCGVDAVSGQFGGCGSMR